MTQTAHLSSSSRPVVDLNGDWERYIHDKLIDVVRIPSSLAPTGEYSLRRTFLLPRLKSNERAFVRFNAVHYYGRVSLNGQHIGTTIPYVPQEFDCSPQAVEGNNTIAVEIVDAGSGANGEGKDEVLYGTPGGWESYGGIVRDAYVEIRPSTFIENVRFGYLFSAGYESAACSAQVFVSSLDSGVGDCEVALFWGPSEVARGKSRVQLTSNGTSTAEVRFDLHDVALWSPAEPNLY